MNRKLVFLSLLFTLVEGSALINATDKKCTTIDMPEEDLRLIKETMGRINKLLDMTLGKDHTSKTKVLNGSGVSKGTPIKVDHEGKTSGNSLLQYLIGTPLGKSLKSNENHDIASIFGDKNIYRPTDFTFRPVDCSELLVAGHTKSGVYKIYPFMCRCSRPVEVFCDMDTEGGGWTLFLQRENASKPINFTRNWQSYKEGFGDPNQEYWLGNDVLHYLTFGREYTLRMEVKDGKGGETWGQWNKFRVDSEENKYKLLVSEYDPKSLYGNGGFEYVNGMNFTTFDQDNDKKDKINCGVERKSGWWHNDCNYDNLTGISGKKSQEGTRVKFLGKEQKFDYVTWLQLKIRPAICNHLIPVVNLNSHNCN